MKRIILLMILSFTSVVNAETQHINAVPSNWKLENYFDNRLVVFFSGSSCSNGRLSFPSSATTDDKNRFWSLILMAKTTNQYIFVRYDDSSPSCDIVSFGISS